MRKKVQEDSPDRENKTVQSYIESNGKILGKSYFRDPEVNQGFYSKKREGVADVDPKVTEGLTLNNIGDGAICTNSRETS